MARERSQGTVRWRRSIRAALDGITRFILLYREQQQLIPRLPGEGRGLGQAPQQINALEKPGHMLLYFWDIFKNA